MKAQLKLFLRKGLGLKARQGLASRAGMTLLEIMMVLVLLGMVMTMVGGKVFNLFKKGQRQTTKLKITQLGQYLDRYQLDCNRYPNTEQGLQALLTAPSSTPTCKNYDPNGYTDGRKDVIKDAWDNPLTYESDGSTYVAKSLGKDGVEGGDGDNSDISSKDE